MQSIGFTGYISLATLILVLGLFAQLAVMNFKFKLMWRDYCQRKGIPYNGDDDSSSFVPRIIKSEGD